LTIRISSTFLGCGEHEEIICSTLDKYSRGEDLSDSPLVRWGRETVAKGKWWYECKNEEDIQRRQKDVIDLYNSIKEKGYNGSVITVFFDNDGYIQGYDGFHRLCIMKHLGIVTDVNVSIRPFWDAKLRRQGDFPLDQVLAEINSGKNLYQPSDDERVKDWTIWRPDSPQRLQYILGKLAGKTVLDIGCSEGYFTIELAKRGYSVTALDADPRRVAVTRYLSTIRNLKVSCEVGKWETFLQKPAHFDSILFLSVFHHNMLRMGVEEAFKSLRLLRGKSDRLFLETPLSSEKIGWLEKDGLSEKKGLYRFTEEEFAERIKKETGYTLIDTWRGIRPIFLLEAKE